MTGGELVVRSLIEQRIQTVFGIPGALNIHLYHALRDYQRELRHVLVRNELGGAWMADGYARAGGDIGVVCVVPGPGASHAVSAVAGAYTECSRVLVLASQSETQWADQWKRDLFHGLDQVGLYSPVAKHCASVKQADEIPGALAETFAQLRDGRAGPVLLEVPADVLGAPAPDEVPPYHEPRRAAPDPARVRQAAEHLAAAERPLILAGDGVYHSDALVELEALANRLRAPVITTGLAKGALPEDHPQALGDLVSPSARDAYLQATAVLAVGVRFVQTDTRMPWFVPPPGLVHVDADEREIGRRYPPEIGLAADPKLTLAALEQALGERAEPAGNGWNGSFPELKRRSDERADAYPVVAALRRALPREAAVAWDVCYPGFRSRMDWLATAPRTHFYAALYVGMGFGLPIGIGAQLARPERPTCVVAGDGGFQMTLQELGTAAQAEVPLVVVLVNDRGLTLIRNIYDQAGEGKHYMVDLVNPDFVALAKAYGIPAQRVRDTDALETAVREAVGRGTLSFIELELDPPGRGTGRKLKSDRANPKVQDWGAGDRR